jgi:ligand-binding SRPBCC domain-containing protein
VAKKPITTFNKHIPLLHQDTRMRQLEYKQLLPLTSTQAWDFFSNPANLQRITPPEMQFIIRSAIPDKIYPGLIIRYRVSPLFSIPLTWVTEITHVKEPDFFVDELRAGPYAIWHHEHHFEACERGIIMTDRLFYRLPGGWMGRMLDALLVRRKVEAIFDYRKKILENYQF